MRECFLRETEPPPPCPYPRHWTDGTTDVFTPRFSGTRAPGVPTSRVIRAAPSPRGGSYLRKEQAECQRASAVICSRIAHAAGPPAPAVWQSVSAILLPLRASAWRHPVALQHAVEGPAVDAEHLSGPAHVAPALLEDAMHVATLQLRQRGAVLGRGTRRGGPRPPELVGQVLGGEHLLLRERDAAFERVRQLAHVAGPVIGAQPRERLLGDPGHRLAALTRRAPHQVIDEQRNVLAPLAQRRELERHHLQAIVEVLAEAPLLDGSRQLAVGRRDDAHVDGPPHRAAHRPYLVLLEDAQELRLERRRDVADLVQENRAAVGLREVPGCVADRAGESAAHVPEELALEQRLGWRAAVDGQERPLAARAVRVDGACDELLAGAALAEEEHRAAPGRNARDRRSEEHTSELQSLTNLVCRRLLEKKKVT